MNDLRDITVVQFSGSVRRPILFAELERLHADIASVGAVCELWIDGSFVTEKAEPNDIDVLFWAYSSDMENLDRNVVNAIILNLNGGHQYSPLLDTYINFRFPEGDPRGAGDRTRYWAELWGKGWDDHLTGYAVIRIGESRVGLRLLT